MVKCHLAPSGYVEWPLVVVVNSYTYFFLNAVRLNVVDLLNWGPVLEKVDDPIAARLTLALAQTSTSPAWVNLKM